MHQLLAVAVDWLPEIQVLFAKVVAWLKEWQFLVGSLIVLFAGAVTVGAINRQIRRQVFEVEERRRRRARAFRTSMPEELDAICSYVRRSADVTREAVLIINAKDELLQIPSIKKRPSRLRRPTLQTYVLTNLKSLMEELDHASAEQVARLLGCYHTHYARLAALLEDLQSNMGTITPSKMGTIMPSKPINFNLFIKSTLELYLRATGMLPFARGETENIPTAFDGREVLNALKGLNIDDLISPETKEHYLRFFASEVEK